MAKKQKSFEDQVSRLEEIVNALEQGDIPLEQGVALFQEGSRLAKSCREQLKEAKHTIQVYAQGILEDLDPPDQPKERPDDETEA